LYINSFVRGLPSVGSLQHKSSPSAPAVHINLQSFYAQLPLRGSIVVRASLPRFFRPPAFRFFKPFGLFRFVLLPVSPVPLPRCASERFRFRSSPSQPDRSTALFRFLSFRFPLFALAAFFAAAYAGFNYFTLGIPFSGRPIGLPSFVFPRLDRNQFGVCLKPQIY